MKILLCDDEHTITSQLKKYILRFMDLYHVDTFVSVYNSGSALLKSFTPNEYDALFLDIDLKDSNGIQIAHKIRTIDKRIKIIFITSHANYKSAAFSVRAFGYIDKPLDKEKTFAQLADLLAYKDAETPTAAAKFETTEGYRNIPLDQIIYFEHYQRKTSIITLDRTYLIKQRISALEKQLRDYHFALPHTSYLVNLDYVTSVKNYMVHMIRDITIPLSQRKSAAFRLTLDTYIANHIHQLKGGLKW